MEKVQATKGLIRVALPPLWAEFVAQFFALGPVRRWMFSQSDRATLPSLHSGVFALYVRRFSSAHLEPYDCRCFGATAYYAVGAAEAHLMALGGWKTARTMYSHYVEASYVLPQRAAEFYVWLKAPPPIAEGHVQQRVGEPVTPHLLVAPLAQEPLQPLDRPRQSRKRARSADDQPPPGSYAVVSDECAIPADVSPSAASPSAVQAASLAPAVPDPVL